jgi:hypothetical protein
MGQVFTNGKAMIPKDVHVAIGHVLRQDYSAVPLYEQQESSRKEDKSKAETVLTPAISSGTVAPDPFAQQEEVTEQGSPDDEAPKKRGKK